MEVQLLETNRHSFVKPERHGSLYDETPLFGNNLKSYIINLIKFVPHTTFYYI